jgi:trehalose 6-phosphate phosphatase
MPDKTKKVLRDLVNLPNTSISFISGRPIKELRDMIRIRNAVYAGNHGLEIQGRGMKFVYPVSEAYRAALSQIRKSLRKRICMVRNAFVEDKGLSLSLHYRLVDKNKVSFLKKIFYTIVKPYLAKKIIIVRTGKKVLEVRPFEEWDKGLAVKWILSKEGEILSKGKKLTIIYIGDDRTDEDAFAFLKGRAVTIRVGYLSSSFAEFYMKDTEDVYNFLFMLKNILRLNRAVQFWSKAKNCYMEK